MKYCGDRGKAKIEKYEKTTILLQTEIFTHFPGDLLRKMNIFIINKQGDAQNLLGKMTLHFSLGHHPWASKSLLMVNYLRTESLKTAKIKERK